LVKREAGKKKGRKDLEKGGSAALCGLADPKRNGQAALLLAEGEKSMDECLGEAERYPRMGSYEVIRGSVE